MNILIYILKILAFTAIIFVTYNLLKYYILSKFKVKHKWIILVASIVLLILPAFLRVDPNSLLSYVFSGVFLIAFLWYMDLKGFMRGRKTNKKNDIIRPKPKSNKSMRNQKR